MVLSALVQIIKPLHDISNQFLLLNLWRGRLSARLACFLFLIHRKKASSRCLWCLLLQISGDDLVVLTLLVKRHIFKLGWLLSIEECMLLDSHSWVAFIYITTLSWFGSWLVLSAWWLLIIRSSDYWTVWPCVVVVPATAGRHWNYFLFSINNCCGDLFYLNLVFAVWPLHSRIWDRCS